MRNNFGISPASNGIIGWRSKVTHLSTSPSCKKLLSQAYFDLNLYKKIFSTNKNVSYKIFNYRNKSFLSFISISKFYHFFGNWKFFLYKSSHFPLPHTDPSGPRQPWTKERKIISPSPQPRWKWPWMVEMEQPLALISSSTPTQVAKGGHGQCVEREIASPHVPISHYSRKNICTKKHKKHAYRDQFHTILLEHIPHATWTHERQLKNCSTFKAHFIIH